MDRRRFLKSGVVATSSALGGAALTNFATPAIAQGTKELRLVHSWPKGFPGFGTVADHLAGSIETMSGGRYKVRVFAGGELVHPLKCHDAVQEGTADFYLSADYYYQGKFSGYNFFAAVPFGFSPSEMDGWIHHGGGQALWDEAGGQFGIKHLLAGNTGSQMAGWFRKPIVSVDDFKGLKMRIPGLGGTVVEALGGTSVTLAGGDILPALQSGAIDATEWVGPWSDLAFGLYKVTKHYHYPGFHEPGTAYSVGISRKLWDSMSNTDREIFRTACVTQNNLTLAEFTANNAAALATLLTKHGVTLHELPDNVFTAAATATRDILAKAGNADPLSKKVYESFMKFRKDVLGWTKLSDQAYYTKRALGNM
jgi:TRAP-type mannitol/chloroaromatic compound transport system substrate-binding protein